MTRGRGRPRDASIDLIALDATRDLLTEVGFDGTTMQAVAKRAEIHTSALYRRWPSRIEMIEDAVTPMLVIAERPPTGDLLVDLRRLVRAYLTAWSSPAARTAMPGLLTHYASVGSRRTAEEWLSVSVRPQFVDILAAAPSDAVDNSIDPDDVFDVMLGAILARTLIPTVTERDRPAERLVELLVRMLSPTTTARPTNGAPR